MKIMKKNEEVISLKSEIPSAIYTVFVVLLLLLFGKREEEERDINPLWGDENLFINSISNYIIFHLCTEK